MGNIWGYPVLQLGVFPDLGWDYAYRHSNSQIQAEG
jgi:hypothetical protein